MNVPTIKGSRYEHLRQFNAYRKSVAECGTPEYRAILETLRQLKMGKTVLSLSQAIAGGGTDEHGRPKLAVCRADTHWVWFCPSHIWRGANFHCFVSDSRPQRDSWMSNTWSTKNFTSKCLGVRANLLVTTRTDRAIAQAPLIPPSVRPRSHLSRYHVLFEADWQDPPRDPLLLRKIAPDLYVVLAQWDLTEVERLALATARNL